LSSSGRIDRKIEFPLPDIKTKRRIFGIHTGRMTLAEDVDLEVFIMAKDELSGADIKVIVMKGHVGKLALWVDSGRSVSGVLMCRELRVP
jgi:ATP-dependent 26S proteasome regulatory subunit